MSETTWFYTKFLDKGTGATRMSIYVQGATEEDARDIAGDCDRLNVYDTTAGTLTPTEKDRDELEHGLIMPGGPNEAITADGEVLLRSDVN